jgi:hypothetical protein
MDIQKAWQKALKQTEIIRPRIQHLLTFRDTVVPYILLSPSVINVGDTVVRKGEVLVERPSLILPPNIPQLQGFEFDNDQDIRGENEVVNYLLVRGISLPSMHYNNRTHSLDVFEGDVGQAVKRHLRDLQRTENVQIGLLIGPEDCWQFSVLIYICTQVARNAEQDFRKLLQDLRRRDGL